MRALAGRILRIRASMALSPHDTSFGSGLVAATDDDAAGRDAEGVLSTTVFCDLDGVLCDFDRGCVAIMGTTPDQLSRKSMWTGLARAASFYDTLEWMPDGRELWAGIVDYNPTILTGLPMGTWAEPQKRKWCNRELGENVPVITCMSRDKYCYCLPGSILIDDRVSLKAAWEDAGGVFIHHTSARSSLEELKALIEPPPLSDTSARAKA